MSDRPAAAPPAAAISTSQHPTQSCASSPPPACLTATTPPSTSCGACCSARGRGHPPGAQPARSMRSSPPLLGGRPRHRRQQLPGRTCRVLPLHGGAAARAGGSGIQVFGGGGGVIVPDEIVLLAQEACIFQPRGRPAPGPRRHDRRDAAQRGPAGRTSAGPEHLPNDGTEAAWRELARLLSALGAASAVRGHRAPCTSARPPPPRARGRHHRYRRRGQNSLTDELIRRLRLDQGDSLRIALFSIDPSRRRSGRRAAGRPHPHECHRAVGGWQRAERRAALPARIPSGIGRCTRRPRGATCSCLHALGCDPRFRQRDHHRPARPARRPASLPALTCCSSRPRASARRRGHRPARRCAALCDDARVRRRQPVEKIDMLDFAALVAINKFAAGARWMFCATWPSRCSATARPLAKHPRPCPFWHHRQPLSMTTASPRLYQALKVPPPGPGLPLPGTGLAASTPRHSTAQTPSSPQAACATRPRSATPCAATTGPGASSPRARSPAAAGQCCPVASGRGRGARQCSPHLARARQAQLTPHA